jgi:beta-galactosidase GanA
MRNRRRVATRARLAGALVFLAGATSFAAEQPMPRLVEKDGRHALFVDGAPYLVLGAQVNNSSAWPATMAQVWPAVKRVHANTVEMPVYWEQLEPKPGAFDYSVVDGLIADCRKHDVRLILLWFATWKNGSPHYMPQWMRQDPVRFPLMVGPTGHAVDSASPFGQQTLDADKRAFAALMRHLKKVDARRTVIMVQVENEAGTWGAIRDYSPVAQRVFDAAVPAEVAKVMKATPAGAWKQTFGKDADELFHAWAVARFIGEVAAAGKAEYALPLYVNAALRDPISPGPPGSYESGGPTDNVLGIWKLAAPAVDILAPDIYMNDYAKIQKVLELYRRPDNALFVPEIANAPEYARFFFSALGNQAIGYSPFGIDYTGFVNYPLGAKQVNEESLTPFASNFQVAELAVREIARLNWEGKVKAVAEKKGEAKRSMELGAWKADVSYGVDQFGFGNNPPGNAEPIGGALVAQLGPDEFLVTGLRCRVDFQSSTSGKQRSYLRVEEGRYERGQFKASRIWNGDQTDWGLNFTSTAQLLRVKLSTLAGPGGES